jgi:hypothetical protein
MITINDLPIPGQNKTVPNFDQQGTDILMLALAGTMVQNPVASDFGSAISNFTAVNDSLTGSGSLTQSNITTAIGIVTAAPLTVAFTSGIKSQMETNLNSLKVTANTFSSGGLSQLALDSASGLLAHTDLVTQNIGAPDAVVSQILSFPNSITTAISGSLPNDFPGIPALSGLTNFGGLSTTSAIASLGLPALSAIPGLPNLGTLPGVNLPGIPDPSAVLAAVSGTVLGTEFGGISTLLSGNASSIASAAVAGFGPLGINVTNILGAVDGDALAGLAPSLDLNVTSLVPGLDSLAGPFGGMAGGLSDALLGEQDALFGGGCSSPALGCGAASGVMASVSSVTNALKSATGASLIASVATPQLSSIVGGFV